MKARILAVLSAALLAATSGDVFAGSDQPLRIDFVFRFNVRYGPTAIAPADMPPWYLWWPADANETLFQHDFQSSPYPTWPATPQAAAPAPTGTTTYMPAPTPFQPVSYPRGQYPAYWYGR